MKQQSKGIKHIHKHQDKEWKELQLQALVDSGCTHTGIDKQLVKEEKIKTELMERLFKVFNADGMKNRKVT